MTKLKRIPTYYFGLKVDNKHDPTSEVTVITFDYQEVGGSRKFVKPHIDPSTYYWQRYALFVFFNTEQGTYGMDCSHGFVEDSTFGCRASFCGFGKANDEYLMSVYLENLKLIKSKPLIDVPKGFDLSMATLINGKVVELCGFDPKDYEQKPIPEVKKSINPRSVGRKRHIKIYNLETGKTRKYNPKDESKISTLDPQVQAIIHTMKETGENQKDAEFSGEWR